MNHSYHPVFLPFYFNSTVVSRNETAVILIFQVEFIGMLIKTEGIILFKDFFGRLLQNAKREREYKSPSRVTVGGTETHRPPHARESDGFSPSLSVAFNTNGPYLGSAVLIQE